MNEEKDDFAIGRTQFGRMAVELGYVSEGQLSEALKVQQEALDAGFRKKLGAILVSLGHLSEAQLQAIMSRQNVTPSAAQIGGFEITGKLGAGAMGTVYKARQISTGRIIALKVLHDEFAEDECVRERFMAEGQAVTRLNHPNIVAGVSVGSERGKYFYAMEYVEGHSLSERLRAMPNGLPEKEALEYVRQVALALQHAHDSKLIHRDIKPANIMVTNEGQAKITDLGLSRALDRPMDMQLTQAGVTVGTPHYVSPEQAQGTTGLTWATDLYALGVTLYHLLTGQVPYDDESCTDVMMKHISDPIPDPRVVNPEVSAAASAICMKLMRKYPQDRYPSASKLAEDLARVLQGEPIQYAKLTPHPTRPTQSRALNPDALDGDGAAQGQLDGAKRFVTSIVKRFGI